MSQDEEQVKTKLPIDEELPVKLPPKIPPVEADRAALLGEYLALLESHAEAPLTITDRLGRQLGHSPKVISQKNADAAQYVRAHPQTWFNPDPIYVYSMVYGLQDPDFSTWVEAYYPNANWVTAEIQKRMGELFASPTVLSLTEFIGTFMFDPITEAIVGDPEALQIPETAASRRFMGVVGMLTMLPNIISAVVRTSSQDTVKGIAEVASSMYFNLGFGFLTWQAIAPFLEHSILNPLTVAMQRHYRRADFTLSQYQDLLAYGEIDAAEYAAHVADLGYSDDKIVKTLQLSYRRFGEGDIARSLEWGMWTDAQASQALRAIGWSKADIPHKLALIKRGFLDETKAVSVSLAEKALRERLISEVQFIEMLQAASKSDAEIKIRLGLVRSQMEEERRSLSVGQIKDAFLRNILTDTEVTHALEGESYDAASAKILLASWKDAKKPKILKVNKGTITLAMARGVLSVDEALRKLQQIGYTSEDSYLIVQTQSRAGSSTASSISLPRAMEAYQRGVINLPRLRTYVEAQVGEPAVVQFWLDLARARTERDLTPSQVEDAFEQQAITREKADALLEGLGYDAEERRVLLDTVESRQAAFKPRLSAAWLVNLSGRGIIEERELQDQLADQGYSANEVDILLRAARHEEAEALDDSAIRAAYLEGVIGPDDVLGRLAGIGYTPQDAQVQLDTWAAQALRTQPRAGENTLVAFAREGLLTADELAAKLEARGLPGDEVRLYVELATFEPQPGTTDLSKTDITGAYGKGLFDRFVATERLIAKGYSVEDAGVLLDLRKPDIRSNPLVSLLGVAGVDPYVILAALLGEGFSEDEVIAVVGPFLGGEG